MGSSTDSLYVSNLNYRTDMDSLRNAFPECIRAQVVIDRNTQQSKGFGFIQFESCEIAQKNLDQVGGPGGTVSIDGRDVRVNYAHTKEQKERGGGVGGGFQRGGRGGGTGYQRGGGRGGGYRGGRGGSGYNNWSDQSQGGYGQGGYNQGGASYGQADDGTGQQSWGGYSGSQQQSYGSAGDYSQQQYGQEWGGSFQ